MILDLVKANKLEFRNNHYLDDHLLNLDCARNTCVQFDELKILNKLLNFSSVVGRKKLDDRQLSSKMSPNLQFFLQIYTCKTLKNNS